jgi:single-strand DNA-binding protein
MAVGETVVTVVGTVVSELSRRTVAKGVAVTSFWMRSTERRRDRESGAWVDGRQLALKVSCRRTLAESVHGSLGKGDPVIVSGRIYTGDVDAEGRGRSVLELEAFAVGPNLSRCSALVRRPRRESGGAPAPGPRPGPSQAADAGDSAAARWNEVVTL